MSRSGAAGIVARRTLIHPMDEFTRAEFRFGRLISRKRERNKGKDKKKRAYRQSAALV